MNHNPDDYKADDNDREAADREDIQNGYFVTVREIHTQRVYIEAGSPEEAKELVCEGNGEPDGEPEYKEMEDTPDEWTVEEANGYNPRTATEEERNQNWRRMYELLKTFSFGFHNWPDLNGKPCLCSQCEYERERRALVAEYEEKE